MITVLWTVAVIFLVLGLMTLPFVTWRSGRHTRGANNASLLGIAIIFDAFEAIPAMLLTLFWGVSGITGAIALIMTLVN
ncbi:MAG: hypothetical protein OSB62_02740 [Alphaproteobacteria bacterium]|nr:hypothetical protein [Alphaproteobacteria bacterium]